MIGGFKNKSWSITQHYNTAQFASLKFVSTDRVLHQSIPVGVSVSPKKYIYIYSTFILTLPIWSNRKPRKRSTSMQPKKSVHPGNYIYNRYNAKQII